MGQARFLTPAKASLLHKKLEHVKYIQKPTVILQIALLLAKGDRIQQLTWYLL